jgi:hypothetical protein
MGRLMRLSQVVVAGVVLLFVGSGKVAAQICSGTVGVECGQPVCVKENDNGSCETYGECGAGLGWQQTLECSAPYGQCKVDNVCAQAGM